MKIPFARLFLVLTGVSACQASASGKLETGGEGQVADYDQPMDSRLSAQNASTDSQGMALLGARQDLSYRGPATAQCKCLAVATGSPGDAAFQWSGARPQISADSQMIVALSSAGIDCPDAGANPPGASYWGYEQRGNDVVVVVEPASPSHPLASGAIIPRPAAGGQLYVRPVEKKLPYGQPSNGTGTRCKVGNVAPPSGAGFVSAETPAPAASTPSIPPPMPAATPATEAPVRTPPKLKGIKK